MLFFQLAFPQDLESLSENITGYINGFFAEKNNVTASVVKFQDFSAFSDLLAQRFYQMVVAKIEAGQRFRFIDTMINFSGNSGRFDLNKTHQLNYLIFLKLIQNRDKLGAGVVIFSKTLDRMVGTHYHEVLLNRGEITLLNTVDFGFQSVGFSRILEINAQADLLDIKSVRDMGGETIHFFYYPDKIILFQNRQGRLERVSSVDLNWERPYYPALENLGILSVFRIDDSIYLTAGTNTSPLTKVFKYHEQQWAEYPPLDFIPLKILKINDNRYLSGFNYRKGKNYFENKITMARFEHRTFQTGNRFEKQVPGFYSLAFSSDDERLLSIHIVDTDYSYRFYSDNFEQQTVEGEKRGAALASLHNQWLAVSDYSRETDTLYFYKIDNGSRQLVYQNRIAGEIVFISPGLWESFPGFWVLVKKTSQAGNDFVLQFWSKGKAPATVPEDGN